MNLIKAKALLALGLPNLARVFMYKSGVKTGLNPVKKLTAEFAVGEFFTSDLKINSSLKPNKYWLENQYYFGQETSLVGIPEWHKNCLTGVDALHNKPWFSIGDFDDNLGDIKGVWEASRFDWVLSLAQSAKIGNRNSLVRLNSWLNDWVEKNPPYKGVNWKCGQEASIRVMHLALASLILEQTMGASQTLISFIKAHLKRISPTIMYAVAQDNNHGTSEAAALYIGGSWLSLNGDSDGKKWQKQGLKWLENRAHRLIESDGSFSQYSVTYHRVMLDTYSLAEVWRKNHNLAEFSSRLYIKLKAATDWLFYFTDSQSGDAPNLGANDGARLIPLTATDYRDFRPCVQLASALFLDKSAYKGYGDFNIPLKWLNIKKPHKYITAKESKYFDDGGYAVLINDNVQLYLNYPKFKFRPSQCDALHIDFWVNGQNVFRDGGTFSYNAGQKYIDYYGGVKSHNTIEFDGHEQMPRLSRFLLGDWLKTSVKKTLTVEGSKQTFTAGYKDKFGCAHTRAINLKPKLLTITDMLSGFSDKATFRLRLAPANWQLTGNNLTSDLCTISFSADIAIKRIELVTGFESRYYYQESEIPVLELEIHEPGIITTEVNF